MRVTIELDIPLQEIAHAIGVKSKSYVHKMLKNGKGEQIGELLVNAWRTQGEQHQNTRVVKINILDPKKVNSLRTEGERRGELLVNAKESERKEDLSPTPPIEENKGKENIIPPKLKSENIKFSSSIPPKGRRDSGEDEEISGEVKKGVFYPPTVGEVQAYIGVKGYLTDAEEFVAFYESKGWMIGKNRMKNWRMALVTWEKARKRKSTDNGYGKDRRNPRCVRGATPVLAASAKDYEGRF